MKQNEYYVTLTNGNTEQTYRISANNEEQAIILAQAIAIKQARGYRLVSVTIIEDVVYCYDVQGHKLLRW